MPIIEINLENKSKNLWLLWERVGCNVICSFLLVATPKPLTVLSLNSCSVD